MKNKKILIVFILIIACLFVMLPGSKATNPLNLTDLNDNQTANEPGTNTQTTPTPTPGSTPTPSPSPSPAPTGNTGSGAHNNSLPDTGVAEDTALFVFITVCVASAVYAFVKIRNYKNV